MAIKSKDKDNKEFYIVDKRILPKSIQNVIKVNDLILKTKMSKYSAIKKVGMTKQTSEFTKQTAEYLIPALAAYDESLNLPPEQ